MSELYLHVLEAKDPSTATYRLDELAGLSKDPEVLSNIAQNPNASRYTLLRLLGEFPREVEENTTFSLLLLEQPDLIAKLDDRTQYQIASHERTPLSLLGILLKQGKKEAHFLIALRDDLTEDFLLEMAALSIEPLRVLQHPNATERVWLRSAESVRSVHQWMAQSLVLPEGARRMLEKSDVLQVQQALRWREEPASTGRKPALRAVGATDAGPVRHHNEDDFLLYEGESLALFSVIDGMGGQSSGMIGAEAVRKALLAEATSADGAPLQAQSFFHRALLRAYDDMVDVSYGYGELSTFSKGKKYSTNGMGAAVVCLLLQGETAYLANIGDSRIYLYRGGSLALLTRDHSLINEAALVGYEFTEEQKKQYKNVITRCVGFERHSVADLSRVVIQPGDLFLLCSDGIHGMIGDEQIAAALGVGSLEERMKRLIQESIAAGGSDNSTVVLVEVEGEQI